MSNRVGERGATLLDVIVGSALMTLVFVGFVGAFKLAVEVVSNNKARAGAIALANERLEFIRSLSYDDVGTLGGIPAGNLEQTATTSLNNVTYTRRTHIAYEDDPEDGLGAADANGIVVDYKAVKSSVSWDARQGGTRTLTMVTRLSPPNGIETDIPGGTLVVHVVDADFQPIQAAQVRLINPDIIPSVDMTIFTDETGTVSVLGAPPAAGYQIVASLTGYSTAQTYGVTATNTNPIPAHIGVAAYQTTAATFEIDLVSSLRVETYELLKDETWADSFADDSNVATSSGIEFDGGSVRLAGSEGSYPEEGSLVSNAPSVPYLYEWTSVSWNETKPGGTDIVYRLYDNDMQPLSNGELSGNQDGFTTSPIDISSVSTSTHALLRVGATLSTSDASTTPSIQSWTFAYKVGPEPLPDIDFNVHGEKTIGIDAGGSLIYKYDVDQTTDENGALDIPSIEWDLYTVSVPASTDYDIASSCPPQPLGILPDTAPAVQLFLTPHTTNSLLVDVRDSGGVPVQGASIRLHRSAFDTTKTADSCGQQYFGSLTTGTVGTGNAYSLEVSADGFTTYTSSEVNVSGTSQFSVILN